MDYARLLVLFRPPWRSFTSGDHKGTKIWKKARKYVFIVKSDSIAIDLRFVQFQEKIGCLWTWIIFQIFWWLLLFIGLIFQAVQLGFLHVLPTVVGSPLFGFLVWLVLRRIKDIKAGSGMGSSKVEVQNRKDWLIYSGKNYSYLNLYPILKHL